MKDHDKYEYVEVALPKKHPAVQRLIAYSDKSGIPLRVLVKSAAFLAYTDDEEGKEKPSPRPAKRVRKEKEKTEKIQGVKPSDAAREAARDFLEDDGF
jgi:hypothetical protein